MESWLQNPEWDDQRRFDMVKVLVPNKKLLDFGCGASGFLNKARQLAKSVAGIELEIRVQSNGMTRSTSIRALNLRGHDLIIAFHVVEHLSDQIAMLKTLVATSSKNSRMVVEVPSSEDTL